MQKPTKVVGRRFVAFLIDFVIWAAVVAISWYALTKNVSAGRCVSGGIEINGKCRGFVASQGSHRTIWFIIIAAVPIGLFIVMQGLTGRTPAKAMLGIKVTNARGERPGILRTIVREVLWIVDFAIIGLVTALATRHNQRVGDLVAGTYVVDRNYDGPVGDAQPAAEAAGTGYGPPPSGGPTATPPPATPQQEPQQPAQGAPQAAAWYPDPQGQARLRYWDGERWTEHTSA